VEFNKKNWGGKGLRILNLNLQWKGYRKKSISQIISEIDHLTKKHKILSVAFMDNLLPLRENREIFVRLKELGKDLRMFSEIRATTPYNVLKTMRSAGVEEVQIGIEALSTQLLKKFNKGTTCIQNLEIMKNCEELGIANMSNLILCFPGSDMADVKQTLHALDFALPFLPLRVVEFWLGLGSPVWNNQHAFGLKRAFNHPNYSALFPPDIVQSIDFMIQSFRGNREYQKKLWMPVKKKVKAWKSWYAKTHKDGSCLPVISFRDGGNFLIIRHKLPDADPLTHRVTGIYKDIYVFCRKNRSIERIIAKFPHTPKDRIISFLKMMNGKKLIYEENMRYLSLAAKVK